jgi:hypothetical protein
MGTWSPGGIAPVNRLARGSYVRPNIVLALTDTAGGTVTVDTVTGVGKTPTTIVVAGTTYYKQ